MKKKKIIHNYAAITAVVIAVILGGIFLVKAGGDSARYYIENLTNFNEASQEPAMGAISYSEGKITYDQLAESVLQEKMVTVSSLSVELIADIPIELLPDAGAGKVNQIVSITGFRKFSSESFSFNQIVQSHEGFEVKWAPGPVTASGLNGHFVLGGSFSAGFTTGDAGENSDASRSVEYWVPSVKITTGPSTDLASKSYVAPMLSSRSAVYLTASSSFKTAGRDRQTYFIFKILYRILDISG